MKLRFFIYGLLGWTMEIFWTGLGSLIKGDLRLQGFSYLWMFPIYGTAVFLGPVRERIKDLNWQLRGSLWMVIIFGIEATAGILIKLFTGTIPWDYTGSSPYSVGGLIRLDYAPVWFGVGLLFERVDDFLRTKLG